MFYIKGASKGLYDLDTSIIKDGFIKIEVVVLNLLL
jgi:hypothetical protein